MAKIVPNLVSVVRKGKAVVPVSVSAGACDHLPKKPVIRTNIK